MSTGPVGPNICSLATVPLMELVVEQIGPREIGRARELMLALHRHEVAVQPALGSAPARSDEDFWRHYNEGFARWHEDGGIALLAVQDGRDVGFLFATEREGLFGYRSSARIGYVEDIAVLEEARGQGVGRLLIEQARAVFRERGYSHFELSSVPGNDDARAFYVKLGLETSAIKLIGEV
jgi:GNAT superfamily N-acetyltransferase